MFFFARLQRSPSRFASFLGENARFRCIHTTRTLWHRWDSVKVEHSQFLSSASSDTKWDGNVVDHTEDEIKELKEGEGKLIPTSSHLFKLILPLDKIRADWNTKANRSSQTSIPTVLLLHPSQPLSHLSRLILASLTSETRPETLKVSFKSSSAQNSQQLEWSDSTDLGDFIRDAASVTEFLICVSRESEKMRDKETVMPVRVPTFADRTRFLRHRLDAIDVELSSMEGLKEECDVEAQRGARRMAVGGFGMLVVYWAGVARLTFWDYGWDVMEPITYLSGLSTVVCGYLWFLYQGQEVSYSSVLHRSVSARRHVLYKAKGLDIDRWADLVHERKALFNEIGKIKEDYDHGRTREQEAESPSRCPAGNSITGIIATIPSHHLPPPPATMTDADFKFQSQSEVGSSILNKMLASLPQPPTFSDKMEERAYLKFRLAQALRIFGKRGFDEGLAGHITVRDPISPNCFWVNPLALHFKLIQPSDLLLVDSAGNILDESGPYRVLNVAAFMIHSRIHEARPDVICAAHSHSFYGKVFAALGIPLDMISQDACAFYNDCALYTQYGGVVQDEEEGKSIAKALGSSKAAILQNHGLLVATDTVEASIHFYIALEKACQVQLMADAAAAARNVKTVKIPDSQAAETVKIVGRPFSGWLAGSMEFRALEVEEGVTFSFAGK